MGDTTTSFAWFNKEPKTFITGINGKCLRVYDLRGMCKLGNRSQFCVCCCTIMHGPSTDA